MDSGFSLMGQSASRLDGSISRNLLQCNMLREDNIVAPRLP